MLQRMETPIRWEVTVLITATLLCCAIARPVDLRGQRPSTFWMEAGLGGGSLPGTGGVAAEAQLAYQEQRQVFSLRGSLVTDLNDGLADLGVLYGRAWSRDRSEMAISAGISLVDSDVSPAVGPRDPVYTWGVPLVVSTSLRVGGFVGLGVEGFANLNPEHSFAGAVATLQLGVLR